MRCVRERQERDAEQASGKNGFAGAGAETHKRDDKHSSKHSAVGALPPLR